MFDDAVYNFETFDRQTQRLEWSARLRGDSTAEICDLIRSREDERARIVEEIYGPIAD